MRHIVTKGPVILVNVLKITSNAYTSDNKESNLKERNKKIMQQILTPINASIYYHLKK